MSGSTAWPTALDEVEDWTVLSITRPSPAPAPPGGGGVVCVMKCKSVNTISRAADLGAPGNHDDKLVPGDAAG